MPNSQVMFTGNGTTKIFSFAGIDDYLSTGYIKVYLNNVLMSVSTYSLDTSGGNENVVFVTAPAASVIIKIARETPATSAGFAANIVDFADGSVLTATDLDKGFKGLLHIVQEANDTGSGALGRTIDGLNWDAQKLRVTQAAKALEADDLVTKAQLDAAQVFGSAVTVPQAWSFTANGATGYTLNPLANATDPHMFIVEVGGILQRPNVDYTIIPGTIEFTTAPATGAGIRVRNFGVARSALDALPNSSVTNQYLAADAVANINIQDDAVGAAELADNAVYTAALQDGCVTNAKLATDAIQTANIANLQVTAGKIANQTITGAQLAASTINGTHITMPSLSGGHMNTGQLSLAHMAAASFAPGVVGPSFLKILGGVLSAELLSTLPVGTVGANLNMNGFRLFGLNATPSTDADAATRLYVDVGRTLWGAKVNATATPTFVGPAAAHFDVGIASAQAWPIPKAGFGTWSVGIFQFVNGTTTGTLQFGLMENINSNTTASTIAAAVTTAGAGTVSIKIDTSPTTNFTSKTVMFFVATRVA